MSSWQTEDVVRKFLENVRANMPYGADQIHLMLSLVRHFRPVLRLAIDLGCGDGILSRSILESFPESQVIGLDHSQPMLDRAWEGLASFRDRFVALSADLLEPLRVETAGAPVDLVVSGFAIHHLPHERKRSLYGEIFELLAPGGLFINIEHVASPTPELESLHDALFVDHLASRSARPREEVADTYYNRADRADNILLSVEAQLEWLRELGFEQVDCTFKWMELAVFGGVKPG